MICSFSAPSSSLSADFKGISTICIGNLLTDNHQHPEPTAEDCLLQEADQASQHRAGDALHNDHYRHQRIPEKLNALALGGDRRGDEYGFQGVAQQLVLHCLRQR